MLTPAQLRAARGLLDWTRADLAKAANISPETIKNIEHGTFRPQEATTEAIRRAFAAQDVEFTDNEGVRRMANAIVVGNGKDGLIRFLDDLYHAAQLPCSVDGTKPVCGCNINDYVFRDCLGSYIDLHVARTEKIQDFKIMLLLSQDSFTPVKSDYRIARYLPKGAHSVPFYVYLEKLAIIDFESKNSPNVVIIHSPAVADSYRNQFMLMWAQAEKEPLKKTIA